MPYVILRHKVADYAKWKRVVRSVAAMRKKSGESSFQVYRDSRRPNDLTVICSWDTAARMKKFMKSADLRKGMKAAGALGKPVVQLFSKAEVLSV